MVSYMVYGLLNKVPIVGVQKQVGHKRGTTTHIHSDVASEQVKEACDNTGFE